MKRVTKVFGLLLFFLMSVSSAFSYITVWNKTAYRMDLWVSDNTLFSLSPGQYKDIILDPKTFYFSINGIDKRSILGKVTFVDQSTIKNFKTYTLHICADENGKILKKISQKRKKNKTWHIGLRSTVKNNSLTDGWMRAVYSDSLYVDDSVLKEAFLAKAEEEWILQEKIIEKKLFKNVPPVERCLLNEFNAVAN